MSSSTPKRIQPSCQDMIQWLRSVVHRPPLPECPREAARAGKEPKQPAFISSRDRAGHARVTPIAWKLWVDPDVRVSDEDIRLWWSDPATGLGTLGGWNGEHFICWIDIDLKHFGSVEVCEETVQQWLDQFPILKTAHRFRTQSGGYRILVASETKPEGFGSNSQFTLNPRGQPLGELLCGSDGRGGHTLLPPTKGLKGDYVWELWSEEYPVIVGSVAEIGIHPVKLIALPTLKSKDLDKAIVCLNSLPIDMADDYSAWLKVGMACHQISHEAGDPEALLPDWIRWSQGSEKFSEGECERKWHSFRSNSANPVGLGTLISLSGKPAPKVESQEDPISYDAYRSALEKLQAIQDPVEQSFTLNQIARTFSISPTRMESDLRRLRPQNQDLEHRAVDLAEFLAGSEEALTWLVPSLIPAGETVLLASIPKCGKTLLAYELLAKEGKGG